MITFDRIICINLDRRSDRWQSFQEHLATAGWPLGAVERFSAIDGKEAPLPKWWRIGTGAWGCHQSHVRVMERAIENGVGSLLILEDDAVLVEGFAKRVAAFLRIVPQDWDGLMLGGQHLEPPEIITPCYGTNPGLLSVRNGNRTHAYALRGQYLLAAHHHLCDYASHAKRPRFHVDHRLGMLHKRFRIYAPEPWLIGQAAGESDVATRQWTQRFWNLRPQRSTVCATAS